MTSGNKGFSDMLTTGLEDAAVEEESASAGIMASRTQTLARLATGKVVTDRTEFVDPARCRPWRLHNRDLDHLNEESCRDLIDAFLSAKKQRIPAIVRRVQDDPDHEYEIIAGVRRWWTVGWLRENNHPEFDYLVTIQKIADEEAFRVSDIENRSRKDISDWERAREYTRALSEFYDNSQSKMAEHINISKSWLSRLIDVGRIPEALVQAFADTHEITVRIARDIKPLVSDPRALAAMTAEANRLVKARTSGDARISGVETAKRLIRATTSSAPTPNQKVVAVSGGDGKRLLTYAKSGRGGAMTVSILPRTSATRDQLLQAFGQVLDARTTSQSN